MRYDRSFIIVDLSVGTLRLNVGVVPQVVHTFIHSGPIFAVPRRGHSCPPDFNVEFVMAKAQRLEDGQIQARTLRARRFAAKKKSVLRRT